MNRFIRAGLHVGWAAASAALVGVGALQNSARAEGGDLDPKFGTEGKVITDFGGEERVSAVAVGPRGKIVVAGSTGASLAGDLLIVRYGARGELDTSFGDGGKVITDLGNDEAASDVLVSRNGKILVVGESGIVSEGAIVGSDLLLVRYDPDGTLDEEFGRAAGPRARKIMRCGASPEVRAVRARS